jgi:ribonuclease M5
MKKIQEVIVVEGKTDTAIIKKLFDADTIETHGLALDEKTLDFIEKAQQTRGVIILTDPDYPGMKIRNDIMQRVPEAKHAFVSREDAIGEKKLGIAEAREEAIIEALENVVSFSCDDESISWEEFISLDIIGDKKRRLKVYDVFHLGYGNAKTLFKRLNLAHITKQDIIEQCGDSHE